MSKILVIDDDPDYTDMLVHQFNKLGHDSRAATCLDAGLKAAPAFLPDIIFLDVNLPDGNGLAAIAPLRESPSQPEIIIITGLSNADGAELAIRGGAWDYVAKGGSVADVVLSLRHALDYREQKKLCAPRALDLGVMIGKSPAMKACFDFLAQAAGSEANVLITGESGTGKELYARAIHANSRRAGNNFVVVDCASLPENLVESILFGHRKGAFTGATENRVGLLEQADGGTLFLDEVAEMPLAVQKSFLRAIQERRFRPVGSDREAASDFRLIAATNLDPDQQVMAGHFRQDLLFRLRALANHLPPLRDRVGDTREIAKALIARICDREGVGTKGIAPEFYATLSRYPWPGNVRELLHAMEYAVVTAGGHPTLYPAHLPTEIRVRAARVGAKASPPGPGAEPGAASLIPLKQLRHETLKRYLVDLMHQADGDIDRACRISQVSRSRLYGLLKQYDIQRPD